MSGKPAWRDEYVRGEVRSSSIELTRNLALVVHRHIDYPPDVWLWSTRSGVDLQLQELPAGLTLDDAKKYALARLWSRLDDMHGAIEAAQEAFEP